MNYVESPPSAGLASYVKCFWSLEYLCEEDQRPEPVIPDGCIEIVFNLAKRFRRYHVDGSVELQPAILVAGQMDRRVLIGPSGNVCLFGIRFKTAGAYPFFDFALAELNNRIVTVDTIWGNSVPLIEEQLLQVESFPQRVIIAEAALAAQINERRVVDASVFNVIDLISRSGGTMGIRQTVREMGISERTLERLFTRFVGLTPKSYSRIVRFQRVLRFMEREQAPCILDAAHSFGYYDQSHLINDFRQYTGMSPGVFAERSHGITNVFISGE